MEAILAKSAVKNQSLEVTYHDREHENARTALVRQLELNLRRQKVRAGVRNIRQTSDQESSSQSHAKRRCSWLGMTSAVQLRREAHFCDFALGRLCNQGAASRHGSLPQLQARKIVLCCAPFMNPEHRHS